MRPVLFPRAVEVMDTEPSLVVMWGLALIIGWAAFATAREWRWGWVACVPVLLLASLPMVNEQYDPVIGPMMWSEAGAVYRVLSHMAIVVMWGLALGGWIARRRARYHHLQAAA